jgi:hypothetical protein
MLRAALNNPDLLPAPTESVEPGDVARPVPMDVACVGNENFHDP